MGKALYDEYSEVKKIFNEASEYLGYDVANKCFNGSLTELNHLDYMLTSILVVSIGTYQVFKMQTGIVPIWGAGHSLGQYTALVCSGLISIKDALHMVITRNRLTKNAFSERPGGMTVVEKLEASKVVEICKNISGNQQFAEVSCYNTPTQVTVSGYDSTVRSVEKEAIALNGTCSPLFTHVPFHCKLLKNIEEEYLASLQTVEIKKPAWPVLSNCNPDYTITESNLIEEMCKHLTHPVMWRDTMLKIDLENVDMVVEIGPQSILTSLINANCIEVPAFSFCRKNDIKAIQDKLNVPENINKFKPTVITKCLGAAVSVPNKNWNENEYTEGVVKPFEKIRDIQLCLEKEKREPTTDEMKTALSYLCLIFHTKHLPMEERTYRLNHILSQTDTQDLLGNYTEDLLKGLSNNERK